MDRILYIRVHYTWIVVFALVTAIVSTQFSENFPLWQRIILGIVVSLLLLAAVTIRELVLDMAACRREIPFKKITLFVFGGVHRENRDTVIVTHLRLLYLAKFLSNLVIAVVFYGLCATFINVGNLMAAGAAQWLAYIFFLLFLLHFIPAFPLDAGQILRMILWRSSGDYYKATYTASLIGWAVGLFSMFAGVLVFIVTQQWIISLIMISAGWIMEIAAGYTRSKIKTMRVLQGIEARDIMTREYPVMPRQENIGQVVREHLLKKGWHYIIVVEGTQLKGILTLNRIKSVPGTRWNNTSLGDIMTPYDRTMTAGPRQTADSLFEEMDQRRLDLMPVLEADSTIGVVTREALMGLVKTRAGLGV
jgi:Zn-dependent protease